MKYLYGEFPEHQLQDTARLMHGDIHKLLIYKDNKITEKNFKTESDFIKFFDNLLLRFDGINHLLNYPKLMLYFMGSLQKAYDEAMKEDFNYAIYRKLILDAHNYLSQIFEK